ncbi:MAG TPA: glutamine-hydrolyzing GMP synthase, partial [Spirochaetota bacterium]|nr:glutamine-hydrolyzing GMP synthase [Spirochaetota bacterium]
IDNGLLRKNEADEVIGYFKNKHNLKFRFVNAAGKFITALLYARNPERKRAIIGRVFVKIFNRTIKNFDFLAQGTLYPDVIESVSTRGPSAKIKTHHNRVKSILKLQKRGRLIEPFKELFKDEVREIGKKIKLPLEIIQRHPFPGPGLAVRILGRVTRKRLFIIREADAIVTEEIKKAGKYNEFWQCFAVLLPVRTVGVMGDKRTYGYAVALRIVESTDGMTADFSYPSKKLLNKISARIIGEIKAVNRVVLDISSKPPATIEWE